MEGANREAGTTQGAGGGVSQAVMREVTGASQEGFREEGAAPLAEVKVSTNSPPLAFMKGKLPVVFDPDREAKLPTHLLYLFAFPVWCGLNGAS